MALSNHGRPFKGKYPVLGERVYVDPSAVIVGDIEIGADSSIWPLVAARGDVNHIQIGARTNVQDGSILHVTRTGYDDPHGFPLTIGDDVTVGHQVMLHGCTIGNRILIGMSAVVMDGAVVEDDVIIGGGSLVPPGKRLEAGYLYVGSPVKKTRALTDEEKAFLTKSAANYVILKDDYLAEA